MSNALDDNSPVDVEYGYYAKEFEDFSAQLADGEDTVEYMPSATAQRFHQDTSRWRCIIGPVGSGKSVACVLECFSHMISTPPIKNIRHSRILVVRSTFGQLKSTTIPTFRDWIGHLGKFRFDSPISFKADFPLDDGTIVHSEVWFMPLDKDRDIAKLRSLEISFAWVNEGSLIPNDFTEELSPRLRYLSGYYRKHNVVPLHGVIIDTNAPSQRHWIYKKFEVERSDAWRIFKQPPGLLRNYDNTYDDNPLAENVENLPIGYYRLLLDEYRGDQAKINTLILGLYGSAFSGQPVYDGLWSQREHVSHSPLHYMRNTPLVIGMDWGLRPAAIFMQMQPNGGLAVLDELVPENVTLKTFMDDYVIPRLRGRYRGGSHIVVADPAGMQRSALSQQDAFSVVRSYGIEVIPGHSQDVTLRRDAVGHFLLKRGGLLVDAANCPTLIEGFDGGYKFSKPTGGAEYRDVPDKNMFSHPHDAMQYAAMYYYKGEKRKKHTGLKAGAGSVKLNF
jgi:hypothetical protein